MPDAQPSELKQPEVKTKVSAVLLGSEAKPLKAPSRRGMRFWLLTPTILNGISNLMENFCGFVPRVRRISQNRPFEE